MTRLDKSVDARPVRSERTVPSRGRGSLAASGRAHEGLKIARLLMVLSSISPIFILWAIRGNSLIPDRYFLPFCAAMVVVPSAFLWKRLRTARALREEHVIAIGTAEDHRADLLLYLFAMLLPLYAANLGSWRDLAAAVSALAFIVFLFWHLNLHYMNVLFAVLRYRVFTVYAPADESPLTDRSGLVIITRRAALSPGQRLETYRLSDTVFWEKDE